MPLGWFFGKPWPDVLFSRRCREEQAGLAHATREQMIERICAHQPLPPSRFNPEVRGDVDVVVMRALAKAREARFATAGDFELALIPITGQGGPDAAASLLSHLSTPAANAMSGRFAGPGWRGWRLVAREPPVGLGSSNLPGQICVVSAPRR